MAKVQVRRGRIDAQFDAERLARPRRSLELGAQVLLADDLRRAFAQGGKLLVDGTKLGSRRHDEPARPRASGGRAACVFARAITRRPSTRKFPESTKRT